MKCNLHNSLVVIALFFAMNLNAQITTQWGPDGFVKIENGLAGLNSNIASGDIFGQDHDKVGDVNGDGIIDLVVGSRTADDGGTDNGAVHILFMNSDGTVQSNQKISMLEGGFTGTLTEGNNFGYGVAGIGDYDNDGIPDIAVAAPLTTDIAIYIIHLNADGTVKSHVKNQVPACLGLTAVGDLNNDGRIDLVACDPSSDLDGNNIGAIRFLFFDNTSTIIASQTKLINPSNGGFGTGLVAGDQFGGREVGMLGDIDGDGTLEMAVGAFRSDGGKGAIWMLSLNSTTLDVVSKLKITEGLNGFSETLSAATNSNGSDGAQFGHALCNAGDLNGDGIPDLMTGANQQSVGYILYLNADKTVKTFTRISNDEGGFDLALESNERFSRSISFVGDLRGDGTIAVTYGGGAGSTAGGTLYLLFFEPCNFNQEAGFNHWDGGNTLYSNWTHATQTVSDFLTFEQCSSKAFETDAPYITYNFNDGRCICKDATATLTTSTEMSTAFTKDCTTPLYISPRIMLHGAFSGTAMLTNLDLPTTEPYTALGYSHVGGGGGESSLLNLMTANNIVDWVVVELRDKDNPATVLSTRSALLKSDGNIVSHLDASSPVTFNMAADDYYVAVRHRNHLGVMTKMAVPVYGDDNSDPDDTGTDADGTPVSAFDEFNPDAVTVSFDGDEITIESNGLPNHTSPYWEETSELYIDQIVGDHTTPGRIRSGSYTLTVPTSPEIAASTSATGLGAIGISVTGAPIFNDQERANQPLDVNTAGGFDYAGGHVGPGGYHYHIESSDIDENTVLSYDDEDLVGIMADGFLLYGRKEMDGSYPTDLDASGGHYGPTQHSNGESFYHYHIINEFYINSYILLFGGDLQGTPNAIF